MSNEELVRLIQLGENVKENMSELYFKNIGYIRSVARKYSSVCKVKNQWEMVPIIEFDELLQEAYFGLVKAVEKYDATMDVNFITYASYWIKQAIKRFIENSGRLIRIPIHTQEKVYKYNQVSSYYLNRFFREPTYREYAADLCISEKEIVKLEQFMFRSHIKSLDAPLREEGEETADTLGSKIKSQEDMETEVLEKILNAQQHVEVWTIVDSVLKTSMLNEVIHLRYREGLTLKETGERLGITRDAVRNNESKAIKRLYGNTKTRKILYEYLCGVE